MQCKNIRQVFRQHARKAFGMAALLFAGVANGGAAQAQQYRNNCAPASDVRSIQAQMPTIINDLKIMERLPLTGNPLTRILANPASRLTICLAASLGDSHGSYSNRTLTLVNGKGSNPTIHEGFHAGQDVKGNVATLINRLTEKDAAVALLLGEATAVAYELVIQKEAKNNNERFTNLTRTLTSNDPTVNQVFETAYSRAHQHVPQNINNPRDREAIALSAAGQAVVFYLMNGGNPTWAVSYIEQTLQNLERTRIPNDGRERHPNYRATRDAALSGQGNFLGLVRLVPNVYLGPQADQYLDQSFGRLVQSATNALTPNTGKQLQRRP